MPRFKVTITYKVRATFTVDADDGDAADIEAGNLMEDYLYALPEGITRMVDYVDTYDIEEVEPR